VRGELAVQAPGLARDAAAAALDSIVDTHWQSVLDAVTSGLRDVVGQARALGPVPRSADEAVANDSVGAYSAGRELEGVYVELRQLQATLLADKEGIALTGAARSFPFSVKNALEVIGVNAGAVILERLPESQAALPVDWAAAAGLWWFVDHPAAVPWAATGDQADDVRRQCVAAYNATQHTEAGEKVQVLR
jgi:hypothetical protein